MNKVRTVDARGFENALRLFREGHLEAAEQAVESLIAKWPADAEIALLGGMIANRRGRHDVAVRRLEGCVALKPGHARAHAALAQAYEAVGRDQDARRAYELALRAEPAMAEARNGLGINLFRAGDTEEALRCFERAVADNPRLVQARVNAGRALAFLGRNEAAARRFAESLDVSTQPEVWRECAKGLYDAGAFDAAASAYQRLLEASPGDSTSRVWYAMALEILGDRASASRELGRVERDNPALAPARASLALELLRRGQIARGWSEYPYRPTRGGEIFRAIAEGSYPPALPSNLDGCDILLVGEQGLGDMLFFLRYAAPLAQLGAKLHLRADARLESLVRRAMPVASWAQGDEGPRDAIRLWVGDLPLVAGRITGPVAPSLRIAPLDERVARMRARIASIDGPRVAVAWRAGTAGSERPAGQSLLFKQLPEEEFGRALAPRAAGCVSIQRAPSEASMSRFAAGLGRRPADFSAANQDLEDMLALLWLVDDYVGVSSTNVHLLAALGRKGRILLPYPPEWRWQDSGQSPWFEQFGTYRQGSDGDWSAAMGRLRDDLGMEAGG